VRLDWTTLSEINNYGFDVQRKRADEGYFNTLANSFTSGHGTTNETHNYSFTDSTATIVRWDYRLKQTDLDGTVHYTDPISVNVLTAVNEAPIPTAFALSQNYPDPFNPSTTIQYQLPTTSRVTLKIYNTMGQEVATLQDGVQEAGYRSVVWNAVNVASGVYFYRLDAGQFASVKKLLLLK
jgi:hypothetical protein